MNAEDLDSESYNIKSKGLSFEQGGYSLKIWKNVSAIYSLKEGFKLAAKPLKTPIKKWFFDIDLVI